MTGCHPNMTFDDENAAVDDNLARRRVGCDTQRKEQTGAGQWPTRTVSRPPIGGFAPLGGARA
jgi:hypothetical protein